jgi:hypothetical protein
VPLWQRSYTVQFLGERLRRWFPGRVLIPLAMSGVRSPSSDRRRLAGVQAVDFGRMRDAGIPDEYVESARAGKINPWIVSLGVVYPEYFEDGLLVRSECAERAWKDTTRVLDQILEEAARLGAQVLPVLFPHTLQVSPAHHALYREWKIRVSDEMLSTDRPQQLLREYFASRGVEPLDLLGLFRARPEMLYWERDEHLNSRGQELSAARIAEEFLARYGRKDR